MDLPPYGASYGGGLTARPRGDFAGLGEFRDLGRGSGRGYDLIQEIKERSNDMWSPSPGSVSPVPQQLEETRRGLYRILAGDQA